MSRWQPFTLTAAAPRRQRGALLVEHTYICLSVPDEAVAYLSADGSPADEPVLPLYDLGPDVPLELALDIAAEAAAATQDPVRMVLPNEFGTTDGVLWSRPSVPAAEVLQSRIGALLSQHGLTGAERVGPGHRVVSVGPAGSVPDAYALRPPLEAVADRLAVVRGGDLYEVAFPWAENPLASMPLAASGALEGLSFDGDLHMLPGADDLRSGEMHGSRFRIPMLVPEGVPTGDGRIFKPMALTHRDLPLSLLWQIKTGDGHDGSVVVGRIDTIERVANGLGNALGVFDSGPYGREAERLGRGRFLRGVSADLDQFEGEAEIPDHGGPIQVVTGEQGAEDGPAEKAPRRQRIASNNIYVDRARVMAATLVPKPAFQECVIELIDESDQNEEEPIVADGIYQDRLRAGADEALVAAAAVASHIPLHPPRSWFDDPRLTGPTALTVCDDGRVFGHIAAWHVDHIGMPFATRPPRSASKYAYFHTGVVRTEEGEDVPVGQLTLAGGHADLAASAAAAVKHYDDTASAVADLHAGEDAYGIWVAGALRPSATPEQIRAIRAAAPSGDWRPINNRLELVAVCQVNVPGFPVARARVASGFVTALVAAGASALAEMVAPTVEDRLSALESMLREQITEEARQAVEAASGLSADEQRRLLEARRSLALAKARGARDALATMAPGVGEFRVYSRETREEYAKKDWAMPDGSYPIRDVADLRRAIKAYGRASKEDKPKVRKHIMRRARGLDRPDLIPEGWMKAAAVRARMELASGEPDMQLVSDGAEALVAALRFRAPWDERRHPRDDVGKFRKVLYRLEEDLKDKPGTKDAVDKIHEAEDAADRGDMDAAAKAASEVVDVVDRMADNTISADDQEMLRLGGRSLGEAIARLPMPQGMVHEKMKFTDLPLELRDLIEDLLSRAEAALPPEAYEEAAGELDRYTSGGDYFDSDEIQSHLNRLLRSLI
jgi:hypothetical protein